MKSKTLTIFLVASLLHLIGGVALMVLRVGEWGGAIAAVGALFVFAALWVLISRAVNEDLQNWNYVNPLQTVRLEHHNFNYNVNVSQIDEGKEIARVLPDGSEVRMRHFRRYHH